MNKFKVPTAQMRWFIPCLLMIVALAVWGGISSQANGGSTSVDPNAPDAIYILTGRVFLQNGGGPAANAVVEMYGADNQTTTTDATGTYQFTYHAPLCGAGSSCVAFKASMADPSCEPNHVRFDTNQFNIFCACGSSGGTGTAASLFMGTCSTNIPPTPTPTPNISDDAVVTACPIPTPTPSDTTFVTRVSAAEASTCTYHQPETYDVTANIPIDRVVGEVDDNGRLVDAAALVRNHVVSEFATVTIAAYDVDSDANNPPYAPERDLVTINTDDPSGQSSGSTYLNGKDKKWTVNEFQVPIRLIRFGKKGPNGGPSIPSNNAVSLQIDLGNSQNQPPNIKTRWCTTIAWAAIKFDAMSPVVMVHGNNSTRRFWDALDFTKPFKDQLIPYDNSITMRTDSIGVHAEILAQKIPAIAKSFGAHTVHIVAHSKGGIDVRDFLTRPLPANFGVLSVTTLSSPHNGTAGADYALDSNDPNVSIGRSDNRDRAFLAWIAGVDEGTKVMRVSKLNEFNQTNLPAIKNKVFTVDGVKKPVAFFTFGSDANLDGSHEPCNPPGECTGEPTITHNTNPALNEIRGVEDYFGFGARLIFNTPEKKAALFEMMYRLMGEVSSTKVDTKPNGKKYVREFHLCPHPLDCFQENDFLVTSNSSGLPGWSATQLRGLTGANHATIATPEVAQRVLTQIQTVQPIR